MYGALAPWFHLLTAPADYAEEARMLTAVVEEFARRPVATMLELGSGGGNNASHLKSRFSMTLVDLSEAMLEASKRINPELDHFAGDMRDVRLGRRFDTVLIHDALCYVTSEDDLAAAIETAAAHVEPGGVVIFCPDDTRESFAPSVSCGGHDGDVRSMRYLQWVHDIEPDGSTYKVTYIYALREGHDPSTVEHEEHTCGTFPAATWLRLIAGAGLAAAQVDEAKYDIDTGAARAIFVGVQPG